MLPTSARAVEYSISAVFAYTSAMLILGIDPGLRITGYGLVSLAYRRRRRLLQEAGVLRMKTKGELHERLWNSTTPWPHSSTKPSPTASPSNSSTPTTSTPAPPSSWATPAAPSSSPPPRRGLPVTNLASTMVKRTITGNGHASKQQVQRAVATLCHLAKPPEPPDVADAIAIAWTLANCALPAPSP